MSATALGRRTLVSLLAGFGLAEGVLAQPRWAWRPGLQLYTVRDLLRADPDGTLRSVADIGYREVELPGSDRDSLQAMRERLQHHNLDVASMHASYERLQQDRQGILADAIMLGTSFVVCPSIDFSERRTAGDWRRVCQNLSEAGRLARRHGVTVAYHNHDFEFVPFPDGTTPFDLLVGETDSTDLKLELDVYWAARAGRDPLRCLKDNADRVSLVHLKDMAADGSIVEVGAGVLPMEEIIRSALAVGVRHLFVEQDDPPDPLRSIRSSLRYLESLPADVRPRSTL